MRPPSCRGIAKLLVTSDIPSKRQAEGKKVARAIWSGSLTFGLVNLPIGLFSATQDQSVHFHQFQRETSDRVRYQRINERTGKKVEHADIVKGAEVDGSYVLVEDEELEQIAPNRSRALEITGFVDIDEIDPIYF